MPPLDDLAACSGGKEVEEQKEQKEQKEQAQAPLCPPGWTKPIDAQSSIIMTIDEEIANST